MIKEHQLISVFCAVDDFCKESDKNISELLLSALIKENRGPNCPVSTCKIMTAQIVFQTVRFPNSKTFYTGFLTQ